MKLNDYGFTRDKDGELVGAHLFSPTATRNSADIETFPDLVKAWMQKDSLSEQEFLNATFLSEFMRVEDFISFINAEKAFDDLMISYLSAFAPPDQYSRIYFKNRGFKHLQRFIDEDKPVIRFSEGDINKGKIAYLRSTFQAVSPAELADKRGDENAIKTTKRKDFLEFFRDIVDKYSEDTGRVFRMTDVIEKTCMSIELTPEQFNGLQPIENRQQAEAAAGAFAKIFTAFVNVKRLDKSDTEEGSEGTNNEPVEEFNTNQFLYETALDAWIIAGEDASAGVRRPARYKPTVLGRSVRFLRHACDKSRKEIVRNYDFSDGFITLIEIGRNRKATLPKLNSLLRAICFNEQLADTLLDILVQSKEYDQFDVMILRLMRIDNILRRMHIVAEKSSPQETPGRLLKLIRKSYGYSQFYFEPYVLQANVSAMEYGVTPALSSMNRILNKLNNKKVCDLYVNLLSNNGSYAPEDITILRTLRLGYNKGLHHLYLSFPREKLASYIIRFLRLAYDKTQDEIKSENIEWRSSDIPSFDVFYNILVLIGDTSTYAYKVAELLEVSKVYTSEQIRVFRALLQPDVNAGLNFLSDNCGRSDIVQHIVMYLRIRANKYQKDFPVTAANIFHMEWGEISRPRIHILYEILTVVCDQGVFAKVIEILQSKALYDNCDLVALKGLRFRSVDKALDYIGEVSDKDNILQHLILFLRLYEKKTQAGIPGLSQQRVTLMENGKIPLAPTLIKFLQGMSCLDNDGVQKVIKIISEKQVYSEAYMLKIRQELGILTAPNQ